MLRKYGSHFPCLIVFTLISLVSLNGCESADNNNRYVINGDIRGLTSDSVYLYNTLSNKMESTVVQNGHFIFSGHIEYPEMYQIYFDSAMTKWTDLFLEDSKISVTGKIDSLHDIQITGSSSQDEFQRYRTFSKVSRDEFIAADKMVTAAQEQFEFDRADSLQVYYDMAARHLFANIYEYATVHKNSPIIPYITHMVCFHDPDKVMSDKVLNMMDPDAKRNPRITALYRMLSDIEKTAVGTLAADFEMKERDGKKIILSTFRGKVVLLDFWASWCEPCIKSFPELKKIYEKTDRDKLEIIGFSIDKNRMFWEKAVDSYKIPWRQVVETSGADGPVPKSYGIIFLPTTFLIDRNGKIAGINLHGKKLEKRMRELLHS